MICKELKQQIKFLQSASQTNPTNIPLETSSKQANLIWSSKISNLIEICYALFLLKVINNGTATLKEITEQFGVMFNIDLSDYSQAMKFIKKRKRDSLFLNQMSNTLFQFVSNNFL